MTTRNLVQICYGIPGILSYILVYWALFALRKQLSYSFLLIYCLLIAVNMAAWTNSWFFLKLTNEQPTFSSYYEWMSAQPFLINLCTFLVSHFNYAQNLDLLFLTFDRFAAIVSVTRNLRWWEKHHRWITFLAHLILVGVHMGIRFPMNVSIKVNPSTGYYIFSRPESENFRNTLDSNVRLAFGIAIFLTCSVLNIFSLRILRSMKNSKTKKIQRTLLGISLCIFGTQAANVLIACAMAVFNILQWSSWLDVSYEVVSYFSDLYAIGPALYTIFLPGLIRQFLGRKVMEVLRFYTDEPINPPSVIMNH